MPDLQLLQSIEVVNLADYSGIRVRAGVGAVETVGVGQQDELVSADEHGHLGREKVVVAE